MSTSSIEETTTDGPQATAGRRRWRLLRIVVSAALIAILLWQIDVGTTLAVLAGAHPGMMLLALALLILWRYLVAYRWYLLLRGKNAAVTLRGIARLVLTSTFLGYFLPGLGTEAMRLFSLSKVTADPALVLTSLLVERATAFIPLLGFVLVGVLVAPLPLPHEIGVLAGLGLAAVVLGTFVIMHPRIRALTRACLSPAWLAPVRTRFDKLYRCLDAYRDQPGLIAWSVVLGAAVQILRLTPTAVIAWGLGLDLAYVYFLVIVPVIFLLINLPVSVGGLGIREVSYVYLFGLLGVSAEAALGLSIANYLLRLLSVAPGAWIYARRGITP